MHSVIKNCMKKLDTMYIVRAINLQIFSYSNCYAVSKHHRTEFCLLPS